MKLSTNLPKISYTTTLGDITITNLANYYELTDTETEMTTIPVDSTTTLVEKAASVYDSVNAFWMFLFANNAINPFTLLKISTTSQISTYSNNDTINLKSAGFDVTTVTPGSIITNYSAPTGSAWFSGSTGLFDLNGGYAIVDSVNTFSKVITLKPPVGGVTYDIGSVMTAIVKTDDMYYQYNTPSITLIADNYKKQSELTKAISYTTQIATSGQSFVATTDPDIPYLQLDSGLPPVSKGGDPYKPSGTAESYSHEYIAQNQNIDILAYLPNKFGYKNLNKVIQKYN